MALLRSIATVGGFTLGSRVLGFVRDVLTAALLGAGPAADAFFVAFRLPNLFRSLFAEGAFAAAFVPLFSARLEREGAAGARRFAEQALSVLLWVLLVFVMAFEAAMPWVVRLLAPGFADDPAKLALTVELSRITFPYLLLISLTSLAAGVLNALHRFAAAAATPILLNLCLIGALVLFADVLPGAAHALAWGVAVAGAAQLVWLIAAAARAGATLRLVRPRLTPEIRALLRRILPLAFGAGVYQINLLVSTMIASFLPSGAIAYLFYADRVVQLPLGVIGVAVGTALLPHLARRIASGDEGAAAHQQNRALEVALLFALPAAAALASIAGPVVATLFERGAFDAAASQATAQALAAFAAGLPAYILVKALAPGFFARHDTATPVKISVVSLAANVGFSLALVGPLGHVGIAAATAAASWINAGLLAFVLHRRGHLRVDARLAARAPRMLASSLVMAGTLLGLAALLAEFLEGGGFGRVAALVFLVAAGVGVYGALAAMLGAARLSDLRALGARPATPAAEAPLPGAGA